MREGDPINEAAQGNRPVQQDENTRFTAVNNANNVNGSPSTVVVGSKRSLGGPIAASPQTVARPLEDWQDSSSDHPHKRKRTPDPTGIQHHPSPYTQHHIPPQTPQTPHPQITHPQSQAQSQAQSQSQSHRSVIEVIGSMVDGVNYLRGRSMEIIHSEQGNGVDETKHIELRQLKPAGVSPPTPGLEGVDTKRRKRQFANRTKTGCITCRRRKKKCDEGKPECLNCKRGGFVCGGYTTKISWTKVPAKSTPQVSIHPKPDVNASASTSPSPGASSAGSPGQLLLTGDQHPGSILSRQVNIEKDYPSGTPPSRVLHQPTTSVPPPPPQQKPLIPLQQQQPLQEFGKPRTSTFVTSGPLMPSPRAASPGPSGAGPSGAGPSGAGPSGAGPSGAGPSGAGPSGAGPSGAGPPGAGPPGTYGNPKSEWLKMVTGGWYDSSAPELLAERGKCKQACWKFNNAMMLNASDTEKWRLLIEVLRPRGQYDGMPGGVINNVDVEAPFNCSYGTNISIAEEVQIGPGCTIIDAAPVTIKSRSILDGDVKIYTTIRARDPKKRRDAKGSESAKPVTIDEDCWIGGNTTILPGVTIGRGAVIGAGSVIGKDIPPFTVAAGNPASIISGLYDNGPGM